MGKVRKMLSDYQDPYISEIMKLIETQSKETLANWALDYAEIHLLPIVNKYLIDEQTPLLAIKQSRIWLKGDLKLPAVKQTILKVHELARNNESNTTLQTALRAIGQCASTIHSARHCIGLVFYGALAIVYEEVGTKVEWSEITKKAQYQCQLMHQSLKNIAIDNEPNKAKIKWFC